MQPRDERRAKLEAVKVSEAAEGQESIVDQILGGKIDLILNTPAGSGTAAARMS